MATRQYIGARYVPKFYVNGSGTSEWTANTAYEALTIVTRNGNSYTSKIPVPASVGAPENNAAYWVSTGIYNQQVEAYRQEVEGYREDVATLEDNLADFAGIEIVGAILRKENGVWTILQPASGHTPKHISGVSTDENGYLVLNFDKTYSSVGAIQVTPDEEYGRAGLAAGASVAADKITLKLYHSRAYGGWFDFTSAGVVSYPSPESRYKGDIDTVSWDGGRFNINFKSYVGGGTFNSLNVLYGKGAAGRTPASITGMTGDTSIGLGIYPAFSDMTDNGRCWIQATKAGYYMSADEFPNVEYGNFWISGFMYT